MQHKNRAEPYVAPQNRLEPHTSAFAAGQQAVPIHSLHPMQSASWISGVDRRCKLLRVCVTKGARDDSNDPLAAVYWIADVVCVARAVEVDVAANQQSWARGGAA